MSTGDAVVRPTFDSEDRVLSLKETQTYQTYQERMQSGNDFIMCIAPSSQTPGSGTGKTTMGIQWGRAFDPTEEGFMAPRQGTLDSGKVADELYPNLKPRHPILWDESQGTQQSQGADARRGMSDEVLMVSRAAAIHRWKQIPLIIITQNTKWIDQRMMDIIDRLVLIVDVDHEANLARAVVFDHYYDDLPSAGSKEEYTPAIEDIVWRPLPESDPDYQYLHQLKKQSGQTTSDGGEESEAKWDPWIVHAAELHEHDGISYEQIAKRPTMEYTGEWIRKKVNEYLESGDANHLMEDDDD